MGFSAATAGNEKTIAVKAIAVQSIENRRMSNLLSVIMIIEKLGFSFCKPVAEDVSKFLAHIFLLNLFKDLPFLSPFAFIDLWALLDATPARF